MRRINSSERPLTVCMDCRTLGLIPPCDYCQRSAPCLELHSRADVKNALASLGLEAPEVINAPPDVAPALKTALKAATARARKAGHQVTTEYLLLELLTDLACARVLEAFGANVERLKQKLEAALPGAERPDAVIQAATVLALDAGSDVVNSTDALKAISQEATPSAQLLKSEGVGF